MKIDWIFLKRSVISGLSEDEQATLNEWLEESPEHREFYREVKAFLEAPESFRPNEDRIRQFRTDYETRLTMVEHKKRYHRILKIGRIAASFVLPLGIAFLLWWNMKSENQDSLWADAGQTEIILPGTQKAILVTGDGKTVSLDAETLDVEVLGGVKVKNKGNALIYSDSVVGVVEQSENQLIIPRGGEYSIVLCDGTKVWLNSASELRYPVRFTGDKRKVYLKGEAYFQVAHNQQKAFVVMTDDIEVKVYGTEFNINTRVADYVQTTLVQGSISIKAGQAKEQMLKPNQLAQFDRITQKTEIKEVDVSNYIGWKSGIYVFEDKSIEQIMVELALWYDIKVFFQNNASRQQHFSGSLPRYREINDMLKVIEKTTRVNFEVKKNTVIVN